MEILCYKLEAIVSFDEGSIEKTLQLCEDAINNITNDEGAVFKLKSAIHELLVNAIEHGYKKNPGKVTITLKREEKSVYFEICDEGMGLDPAIIDFDREVFNIESAPGRGWGLIIINSFADTMKIAPNTPKGTRVFLTISE